MPVMSDSYIRNKIAQLTSAVERLTEQYNAVQVRVTDYRTVANALSAELDDMQRDRDKWKHKYYNAVAGGYKLKGERGPDGSF